MPKELDTILANCLSNGRRHFVEVAMGVLPRSSTGKFFFDFV